MKIQQGTGNTKVSLVSCFQLTRDFDVQAKAERTHLVGSGEAGLLVSFADLPGAKNFADVFFVWDTGINANLPNPPQTTLTATNPNSITTVTFRITRTNSILTLWYRNSDSSDFHSILSGTNASLMGPVNVELFLEEEYNSTDPHTATFDNLTIGADGATFGGCAKAGCSFLADPNLMEVKTNGASSVRNGDTAVLSKKAGTGNAKVSLVSCFQLTSDFDVQTKVERTQLVGSGEAGLAVDFAGLGFADVFFVWGTGINANILVSPNNFGIGTNANSSPSVTFRITRTNSTLTLWYDNYDGNGFRTILSGTDASLTGPVSVEVFLDEEYGSLAAHTATFDDLCIYATSVTGGGGCPPKLVYQNDGTGSAVISFSAQPFSNIPQAGLTWASDTFTRKFDVLSSPGLTFNQNLFVNPNMQGTPGTVPLGFGIFQTLPPQLPALGGLNFWGGTVALSPNATRFKVNDATIPGVNSSSIATAAWTSEFVSDNAFTGNLGTVLSLKGFLLPASAVWASLVTYYTNLDSLDGTVLVDVLGASGTIFGNKTSVWTGTFSAPINGNGLVPYGSGGATFSAVASSSYHTSIAAFDRIRQTSVLTVMADDLSLIESADLPANLNGVTFPDLLLNITTPMEVQINSATVTTNGCVLQWSANAASQFYVQWTPTLQPTAWQTISNTISSTTGNFTFTDDGSQTGGLGPTRFYRLQLLP